MQFDQTPLQFAAIEGHQTVVTALIAAGADVNAKTNVRRRPLRAAVLPAGCRMHLQSLSLSLLTHRYSLSLSSLSVLDAAW